MILKTKGGINLVDKYMFYAYIIQSLIDGSYYIGHCEVPKVRLERHNAGKTRSTKAKRPWKLIYKEAFETRAEAYRRELQIKKYKGGRAFKKLIKK